MQRLFVNLGFSFFLVLTTQVFATATSLDQCRQFSNKDNQQIPKSFTNALLWQIQKQGLADSYIFGTIHVSDPRVLELPRPVHNTLNISNTFIMELVPNTNDITTINEMMFYPEDKRLNHLLDEQFFQTTVNILKKYHYSADVIATMKPWAAYLTMNYPSSGGVYLDLLLMNMAEEQQMQIHGLETLREQLSIFNGMKEKEQIQLLLDTVCNYDDVQEGFEKMVTLYLNRDLKGLFRFNSSTTMFDEQLYKNLLVRILTKRNRTMAIRALPFLQKGNVFIAIGAMHLSGKDGFLALLKKQGYEINPLY